VSRSTIFADRPISIEDNPNATIDIDQSHFRDLYLGAQDNTEANIKIASGVNLTNVLIDGVQSWTTGKYGLLWDDVASAAISANLRIENVRWEQATDSTGWMLYLSHNYALQNVIINNVYGTYDQATALVPSNGFYLKNVRGAEIRNSLILAGAGKTSLGIDNTNYNVWLFNVQTESAATKIIPTEKMVIYGTATGVAYGFYDPIADGLYYKPRFSGIEIVSPAVPDNAATVAIKGSLAYDANCFYWAAQNSTWKRVCDNTSNNW
jgi:hypothetical protein